MTTHPEDAAARSHRLEVAEEIVAREWEQFQHVQGEDGRAQCQDDWPTFHQMRIAQFLTWPQPLLDSYRGDLVAAKAQRRNLLTEKYARMMASTEPERYASEIAPRIPALSAPRQQRQERIIAQQVAWAQDFVARYPRLGAGMRTLHTAQDTATETSFETYLRGELGTYSERTLALYGAFVAAMADGGTNLTEQTLRWTVLLGGYESLAQAEESQGAGR